MVRARRVRRTRDSLTRSMNKKAALRLQTCRRPYVAIRQRIPNEHRPGHVARVFCQSIETRHLGADLRPPFARAISSFDQYAIAIVWSRLFGGHGQVQNLASFCDEGIDVID